MSDDEVKKQRPYAKLKRAAHVAYQKFLRGTGMKGRVSKKKAHRTCKI